VGNGFVLTAGFSRLDENKPDAAQPPGLERRRVRRIACLGEATA
jgi:hypothetical protein